MRIFSNLPVLKICIDLINSNMLSMNYATSLKNLDYSFFYKLVKKLYSNNQSLIKLVFTVKHV